MFLFQELSYILCMLDFFALSLFLKVSSLALLKGRQTPLSNSYSDRRLVSNVEFDLLISQPNKKMLGQLFSKEPIIN